MADRFGYAASRTSFLEKAGALGARIAEYRHPQTAAVQGVALSIDTARLGPDRPSTMLVVLSGVHGVEGRAGSWCQRALLDIGLPAEVGVLLIHAVNPWGFANDRRTDAENVDLNRNAIEDFTAAPHACAYDGLHEWLVPNDPVPGDDLSLAIEEAGTAFQSAVSAGQYSHRNGLFYGGAGPAWSRRVLESILALAFDGVRTAIVLDIHTGLGRFGDAELIYTGSAKSAALPFTRQVFAGMEVRCPQEGGSVSGHVEGALTHAIERWGPPRRTASLALEFGVRDLPTTLNALRGAAWLHNHPEANAGQARAVRSAMIDAFFSSDPGWLSAVRDRFLEVAERGLSELRLAA